MRAIWKYPVPLNGDYVEHEVPAGARVLSVQEQGDVGCIWFDVHNTEGPVDRRRFWTFGTGHAIPLNRTFTYLGTYQMANGALVWHVYEEVRT